MPLLARRLPRAANRTASAAPGPRSAGHAKLPASHPHGTASRRSLATGGRVLLCVALLALEGCVPSGLSETVLPAQNFYNCRDGVAIGVRRAPDGRSAVVNIQGKSIGLPRVDSAAQEKYTNGATTLYLDGEQALLTSDSFVVAGPCVSSVPLPVAAPMRPI